MRKDSGNNLGSSLYGVDNANSAFSDYFSDPQYASGEVDSNNEEGPVLCVWLLFLLMIVFFPFLTGREKYVGIYSPEARRKRIQRFLDKRKRRVWTKKVILL